MHIQDLHDLLVGAPTGGSESSALAVLKSLAGEGDLAASRALLQALAPALGCDGALALLSSTTSMEELLAANLPSPLGAYVAALRPRVFLQATKRSAERPDIHDNGAITALQRLILSRDVLQHEALKAHVLTALAGMIEMYGQIDNPIRGYLSPILDLVLANTRIVEGRDADATLNFGRDKILGVSSIQALYFLITHELGHNVLIQLQGRGVVGAGLVGQEPALRDLAAALPQLMDAACRWRGRPIEPHDPRAFLDARGVRLLCTHEQRQGGSYFHMSLMQKGGPMALHEGAVYAYLVLALLGLEASRAAAAWSARGALHLGFRGDQQLVPPAAASNMVVEARIQEALQAGPIWMADLQADGRLGDSEGDVPIALGVEPRRPRRYAVDSEQAFGDLQLVDQAGALPSLDALTEPEAFAVLAAAWRSAAPGVLSGLLHARLGLPAKLCTANWPLGDIGSSLGAFRDEHGGVAYLGPSLSDINAVLHLLHHFGVPLDGPADADGRTLLIRAVCKGLSSVQLVLACGADPNRASADGGTPILACATVGSVSIAEALTLAGASLQSRDHAGRTALHRAAGCGHDELLVWLLQHGADVEARDNNDQTALFHATTRAAVMALCDAGASVHATTGEGMTALHLAAETGRHDVLQALLSRGADPDAATRRGDTPLHLATFGSAAETSMAALLDAGADIEEDNDDGVTALMVAARLGRPDVLGWLLAHGALVDARTVTGETALIMASDGRNEPTRDPSFHSRIEECLRCLVQAGADINATNDAGMTALYAATWGFDAGRVTCLLELGADPGLAAADGTTPLMVAQAQGHDAMVEALANPSRTQGHP